jgi:tight adherence protein B
MIRLLAAAAAAVGVYLVLFPGRLRPERDRVAQRAQLERTLRPLLLAAGPALVAGLLSYVVFGAVSASMLIGLLTLAAGPAVVAQRARHRQAVAHDAWPRMLEELRVRTGSLGRSIPQALFEVGARGPVELRPAFSAGHRVWMTTADFPRAVARLSAELDDATADAVLETLLVAHEIGTSGLDKRLESLVDDRGTDVANRKEARAKQAGVRFARRFVLFVPIGMALVGTQLSGGTGAYRTPLGQVLLSMAVLAVAGCWWIAGRLLVIPTERRVFQS